MLALLPALGKKRDEVFCSQQIRAELKPSSSKFQKQNGGALMRGLVRIALAAAGLVVSSGLQAQTYPSRLITVICAICSWQRD